MRSQLTFPQTYEAAADLPLVTSLAELQDHDGAVVRLRGVYTQTDARMRPSTPPQHGGHIQIVLDDETQVALLPVWQPNARRPTAEVEQFEYQSVEVVGIAYQRTPANPQGGASPTGPCLTEVYALYAQP